MWNNNYLFFTFRWPTSKIKTKIKFLLTKKKKKSIIKRNSLKKNTDDLCIVTICCIWRLGWLLAFSRSKVKILRHQDLVVVTCHAVWLYIKDCLGWFSFFFSTTRWPYMQLRITIYWLDIFYVVINFQLREFNHWISLVTI